MVTITRCGIKRIITHHFINNNLLLTADTLNDTNILYKQTEKIGTSTVMHKNDPLKYKTI